ncbi:MAG TPA: hypothetical protein VK612_11940 [Pyrinomonadaceae bacterium]|nr:hypothetical protein [Pyrinomonadaceae bacterium]
MNDYGKFGEWTTGEFSRVGGYAGTGGLCQIKIAKNKGFDRVVFQFSSEGDYYIIHYLQGKTYSTEAGDEKLKIAGSAVIQVGLYGMYKVDDPPCVLDEYSSGKLNLPSVLQVKEGDWFEGTRDFHIGINVKKQFRVMELTDPARLVIDIKH